MQVQRVFVAQDLHADLDHMANLVTRHQLSAADSPETMSAAAGARLVTQGICNCSLSLSLSL